MSKVFIEDENMNILANANEEPFVVDQVGTDVFVNGQRQDRLDFTSDPQTQITTINDIALGNQAELDKKLDKTECNLQFNQLINDSDLFNGVNSGVNFSSKDGVLSVTSTATSNNYRNLYLKNFVVGHVYYLSANLSVLGGDEPNLEFNVNNSWHPAVDRIVTINRPLIKLVHSIYTDKNYNFSVSPIVIDLTEMFGAGKEPQTVEEVQKYIPYGTYYPYTKGKASIEQANSLSMCPSDSGDYILDKEPTYPFKYVAPANGYISLYVWSKNSTPLFRVESGQLVNMVSFNNNECGNYIPISKGQTYTLKKISNAQITSTFSLKIIFAKEV